MGKFETGSDPAGHTVAEVNEFLKGEEVTGDEYDRVMQAEREGRNRVGIISGSGAEDTTPDGVPRSEQTVALPAEEVEDDVKPDLEDDAGNPVEVEDEPEVEDPAPAEPVKTQTPAEALQAAVDRTQAMMGRGPLAEQARVDADS